MGKQTETALRGRVARALSQAISDHVWEAISPITRDAALQDLDGGFEALREEAAAVLRAVAHSSGRKPVPPSSTSRPEARLTPEEARRSKVLTGHFARMARALQTVQDFRARYLGDRVLDREEVPRFIASPAYRLMSGDQIRRAGMPTSRLTSSELGNKVEILARDDGPTIAVMHFSLRCSWGDNKALDHRVTVPILDQSRDLPWLQLELDGSSIRLHEEAYFRRKYLPGSVVDELERLAESLGWRFWWAAMPALLFVLTDAPPPSPGIAIGVERRDAIQLRQARVSLEIQPWVSPESVVRAYQLARWDIGGRWPRTLSIESLDRFEFCARRRGESEPPVSWGQLVAEWDASRGNKKKTNPSLLSRDFHRTEKYLLHPVHPTGPEIRATLRRAHPAVQPSKSLGGKLGKERRKRGKRSEEAT